MEMRVVVIHARVVVMSIPPVLCIVRGLRLSCLMQVIV